jgi:conjugative transfer pilus assembly protein TraH
MNKKKSFLQTARKERKNGLFYFFKIVAASICLNISIVGFAYAGLDGLIKFASPDGAMSNVNSPAIIKDQAGGYMTGGSILLRGPRPKELNPLSIQTPKLKFDACTGSGDFRFGAMSYISAAEFSSFMKGVARASGAYLVKMTIKSVCPQCEDIMANLEAIARDINGLTLNQCSMAQTIAEGAFSKLTSGEKQHCMMEANAAGSNTDMFDTTRKCQDSAGSKARSSSGEFESLLGDEFNLVWKALSKGTGADTNLKELMMSVSGTIIGKKEDGRYKFTPKPTLLHDRELLERYIGTSSGSSKIKLYVCDEGLKCLGPTEQETNLGPSDTLYGNVSKIMRGLVDKVRADNPKLTDEEESLISFSTIPILHLIEMELATKANTEDLLVRMGEFVEVVCYDVITNFMQIMLQRVVTNVQALEHVQMDDVVIRNFIQDAENTRKYLVDAKSGAFQKLQVIMQVKERLEMQSREFEMRFGRMMKNLES